MSGFGWVVAGRGRRLLASGVVTTLAATLALVSAPGGSAAAQSDDPMADPKWREKRIAAWPDNPGTPATPGREQRPGSGPGRSGLPSMKPPPVVWPVAGASTITIPAGGVTQRSGAAAPGGLPVQLSWTGAAASAGAPVAAKVDVLERAAAQAAGVDGLLLRVQPQQAVAAQAQMQVDYSSFAHAFGGDWASRLRLVRMPDCAGTTPERADCRAATPLESVNNTAYGTVTATLTLAADVTAGDSAAPSGTVTSGGGLFALAAASSGGAGDWSATPLPASATWQVSPQTGDFSWSYPLRVPPSVGGPAPQLTLLYSSGSVDGRVAGTNNQTSWIGDGWELSPGFVERKYVTCADDATGGANNVSHKTGDLCWKSDNATISFNGQASELVKDESSGAWRFKDDDGTKVERLTGAWNTDNDTEYWKVTTTDGTRYFFGRDKRSASDPLTLSSALTVPVFGNHPGEPCYQTSFADAYCRQAWRWNLDYVVDPLGNTLTYIYARESNFYGRNMNQAVSAYDRSGLVSAIEYGERQGSEASTTAPMRVEFTTAERCLTNCASLTEASAANWPDVPFDLICDSSTSCPSVTSPAFFTRKRLTGITTKVWNGSAYDSVDTWTLAHSFPDPGDGLSNPVLWLSSIEHRGVRGGSVTLPKVTFSGVQLANRVDAAGGDLGPAMIRYRMAGIGTETGSWTTINYDPADCTPSSLPASPQSNTRRCMPVYWTPEGFPDPVLEYFHKYRVDNVVVDPDVDPAVSGDPEMVTDYVYGDAPAWHYDDSELVQAKYRTWGEFRGYSTVDVLTGGSGNQSKARYRYFRGMDGDHLPSGSRQVQVDGIDDHDNYAGFVREQITYNGAGGGELSATVGTPWLSPATATAADGTTAHLVGTGTVETRTTAPALPGGVRRTKTVTSFDTTYGMPTQVDDQGDLATGDDDLCTRYQYARNAGLYIVDAVARTETVSTACAATPSRPSDVVSDTRTFYDGSATLGAAPTKGLVSKTDVARSYSGGNPVYVTTSTAGYDLQGRVTQAADALGRTTTTAYTPASGGPLTKIVVTSPDPDGTGSLTAHVTTTDLDPAFGAPTKVTDPNGKVTEAVYDPLGRLLKVWLPGRTTTQTPHLEYAYQVRTNGPNTVTTKTLIHNGSQLPSVQLFDGLLRPRQTQTTALGDEGGRVITDTRYDNRGLVTAANHEYYDPAAPSTNLFIPSTTVPGRTEYRYDGAGRATDDIFLKQGVEQWRTVTTYAGDRVSIDPPTGGTPTTTISDARGKTTALWQYLGASPTGAHQDTAYAYNHAGRLASVTDPAGNTWGYSYDLRGRQTSATDPDRGTTTSTYDDAGQPLTTTDGRGQTLAYEYDNLGRKTKLHTGTVTGTLLADWAYDTVAKGQVTSSSRYDGTAKYTTAITGYDNGYRPLGQSVTLPSTGVPSGESAIAGTYTTSFTYTVDGQLKTMVLPAVANLGAETVTMYYDAVSMPEWMAGGLGWGVYAASSDWSAYGQPLLLDLGNTYFQHVTFDYETGTNRLTNQKLLRQNAAGYDRDAIYGYDQAGNITSIIDRPNGIAVDAQCYRYDGLRRVTEAWTPADADCAAAPAVAGLGGSAPYWTSYSYDPVGNRDTETRHTTTGDTIRDYTYPAPGAARPHAVTQISQSGPGGTTTYQYGYDQAGNTTCRPAGTTANTCPPGTGSQALAWNAEGRMTTATTAGQTGSYVYTADGDRLLRRENGVTTVYLPGGQELRLTTATGAKSATRYYSFGGYTVAVRTGIGFAPVSTLVADHHGTAGLSITNTTNIVTRRYADPFGNPRGATPTWPGDHGFLDKPQDATGLTHVGAREYDPGLGRFVSVDPIMDMADPQQWNGYAYANNNPVTQSDPTGLRPDCGNGETHASCDNSAPLAPRAGSGPRGGWANNNRNNKPSKRWKAPDAGPDLVLTGAEWLEMQYNTAVSNLGSLEIKNGLWMGFCHYNRDVCAALSRPEREAMDNLFKDLTGYTDAKNCFTKGSVSGCAWTAINFTPGKLLKLIKAGKDVAEALRVADDAWDAARLACPLRSFSADTRVLMADGTAKPIAEVEVGDEVIAADPETGTQGPHKVTAVWPHQDKLVDLVVDGAVVATTEDHPFWNATDHQWQRADTLSQGDNLIGSHGQHTTVVGIRLGPTLPAPAYNLTIDDIHTYYVLAGNTPVLVHNANCGSGLSGASGGLKGLFADGSVRGKSIIGIRKTLLDDGFTQTIANNKKGYLFQNSAGEQVRVMRRGSGWDIRVRNQHGNYLDEYGNVAPPSATHGIEVYPR